MSSSLTIETQLEIEVRARVPELVDFALELIDCRPTYFGKQLGIVEAARRYGRRLESIGMKVDRPSVAMTELTRDPRWIDSSDYVPGLQPKSHVPAVRGTWWQNSDLPTLALAGHLDVEPLDEDKWNEPAAASGLVENGALFGRGSADMLAALACFATAIEVVSIVAKPQWNVEVHAVSEEELGGNGTLDLLLSSTRPDFVVLGEPSAMQVCSATPGFHHFRVEVSGPRGHMATVAGGAMELVSDVLNAIHDARDRLAQEIRGYPDFSDYEASPISVGRIFGGDDPAVPPSVCTLEGAIFSPGDLGQAWARTRLHEILQGIPSSRISVTLEPLSFPGNFSSNQTDFAAYVQRCTSTRDRAPIRSFHSPCDLRLYQDFGSVGVVFGPADLAQAHAPNEHVSIDRLEEYTNSVCRLLTGAAGRFRG